MNIIQIGCNDCEDHVFDFVNSHREEVKSLVVIDPIQKCVDISKEKYDFVGNLYPLTCAVGLQNGLTDFYIPADNKIHPHSSVSKTHLINHGHKNFKRIVVPCLTLDTIFEFFPFDIDRLYLDTEGPDVQILLDFNLGKYMTRFIQYEFIHSDGTHTGHGNNQKNLVRWLMTKGYDVRREGEYDCVAELKK